MATGIYHANIHGDRLIRLYADRWAQQRFHRHTCKLRRRKDGAGHWQYFIAADVEKRLKPGTPCSGRSK
jgi:hypothetical protein